MKILIATDGSEYSRAAARESCETFARTKETEVKVVSVYENSFPIAGEPFALSADYQQQIENEARAMAGKYAAEAKEIIREGCPDVALTTEIRQGSPGREIVEAARDWPADLIIVGSHGRGFWGRMLVGSTSDAVMHHAPCSVMIVRRPGQAANDGGEEE